MKLLGQQTKQLNHQGYLLFPKRFSVDDVILIKSQLPSVFIEEHPVNIVKQSSKVVITSMGLHLRDEVFAKLVRHPRLIDMAQQING